MSWSDDWIGLPHVKQGRSRDGCDCLGLFILLHKARFNRDIPDPSCSREEAIRQRVADAQRANYVEVSEPQEGDALLMRTNGHPIHVGYCIDQSLMLHSEGDAGSQIERWNSTRWKARLLGIYRYAGPSDGNA